MSPERKKKPSTELKSNTLHNVDYQEISFYLALCSHRDLCHSQNGLLLTSDLSSKCLGFPKIKAIINTMPLTNL